MERSPFLVVGIAADTLDRPRIHSGKQGQLKLAGGWSLGEGGWIVPLQSHWHASSGSKREVRSEKRRDVELSGGDTACRISRRGART